MSFIVSIKCNCSVGFLWCYFAELIYSNTFILEFLGSSKYKTVIYREKFPISFSIRRPSSSFILALLRIWSTVLNRSGRKKWVEVVKVDILALSLILEKKLLNIHSWVKCWLWPCYIKSLLYEVYFFYTQFIGCFYLKKKCWIL